MQTQLAAIVALTACSSGIAQCTQQVTTPPNFASNNAGAVGGMVFFTLDVTAPNGIRICSIDVHTNATGPIGGTVQVHRSLTDWQQLTGTTNTPTSWCTVGCLTGTGNGDGTPSPLAVVSGSGTIDLPNGQYLVAIGNGSFGHAYTNGTPANGYVNDGNVAFDAGRAANAPYTGSLLGPRVFNGTFHYDVPAAPITTSPCGQTCVPAAVSARGTGCGGAPVTVAEQFEFANVWDLTDPSTGATTDLRFTGSGGRVTVAPVPSGSPIVPPVSADLGLGDDASSPLIPLGFDLGAFGLCADAISVQSNGCIWLGHVGTGDFSHSLTELESEGARVCAFWTDLRPLAGGGGGTVHVDRTPTETLVTYDQVFLWGTFVPLTFQVSITASAITCRYDGTSVFPSFGIVGLHNGTPNSGTGSTDLSAGAGPIGPGNPHLTLGRRTNPLVGGTFDLELRGIPTGGIGAVLAIIGNTLAPAIQPSPPFAPGCATYLPFNAVSLGITFNASLCTTYPYSLQIPAGPMWLGLPYALQGAALDVSANRFVVSNALDAVIGNF